MKPKHPISAVAALSPLMILAACGGSIGPVEGARALAHARSIVGFGPRPAGSPQLRKVEGYIRGELDELGLELRVQAFEAPTEVKAGDIEFRNLWVEIPGDDPNGPILGVGAHYDSKLADGHADPAHNFPFVGALDAAGACGVLLELARVLVAEPRTGPGVWLMWFDGEESLDWDWGDGTRALIGSRHFVRTMDADEARFPNGLARRMKAFVLLDLIGDQNQKIDRDTKSHAKLLEIFKKAADSMGEGDRMYAYESPMTDDHEPFRNYSVKVIDLIDFQFRVPSHQGPGAPEAAKQYTAWWHTREDTVDKLSAGSLEFVGDLVWNAMPLIREEFYK
jgi:glutaminyl-peptide cyclotransferase